MRRVQLKVACMLVHGLTKSIIDNLVKSTKEILWWTKKSEICIECTWNDCNLPTNKGAKEMVFGVKYHMCDPHSCECGYMCQGNKLKFVQRKCLKIYG